MAEKEDIIINCAIQGCEEKRIFRPQDQDFFERKGFQSPKYCRTHSAERRTRHGNDQGHVPQEKHSDRDYV